MSYEYDAGSTRLLVEQDKTMDGVTPLALVQAMDLALGTVAVAVKPEEAPALALAILEAAGIHENRSSDPDILSSWHALNAYRIRCEEDAEYSKVRAFVDSIPGVSWADESPEHWTLLHRAAHKFFTREEKPAPRVLNYGDPEPNPNTRWQAKGGTIWHHDGSGWCTDNLLPDGIPWRGTGEWEAFSTYAFPMTEVTE